MDVDTRGSDSGPCTEVVSERVSPASLLASLLALRRRLTIRFFFFRPDFECLPEPKDRPVVAEFKLIIDDREGE
jgi:hypothetical protein